jgi:hypothetical protein
MRCEQLEVPENGVILPPCNNEFSSVCTILCAFGYNLDGPDRQNCTVNSDGALEWSEAPKCTGNYKIRQRIPNPFRFFHCQPSNTSTGDGRIFAM